MRTPPKEIGAPESAIPPVEGTSTILLQLCSYAMVQWTMFHYKKVLPERDWKRAKDVVLVVEKGSGQYCKENWGLVGRQRQKVTAGIVIKGSEADRWVTISEVAVPLKGECSALAAEIVVVKKLTEVVDQIVMEDLTVKNIESCIVDCVGKLWCASSGSRCS